MPRQIQVPAKFQITVVLPLGKSVRAFTVDGRTAKLIAWCVMHRGRIERVGFGLLSFDFSLTYFSAKIEERFPSHKAEPEVPPELEDLAT